jgi:hypothetical protein
MKMTIQIPAVKNCSVGECAYSSYSTCHAKAITVCDSVHPGCDTYMDGSQAQTHLKVQAGVGACKVSGCQHNVDLRRSVGKSLPPPRCSAIPGPCSRMFSVKK